MRVAGGHDLIRVSGARENNLKDVSVEIPKRRLTVFTGVSGSGKSSLVVNTIAAESQRLINETYSAFVQGFMPALARPDVDVLEGLTTAIIVDQERMGSDTRSTVGTATVPALRGAGHGVGHRPDPALRRLQVAGRGGHHHPGVQEGGWAVVGLRSLAGQPRPAGRGIDSPVVPSDPPARD